jgi:hypothetical protein
MRRHYFFLMLNTIFLPITGLTSIGSLKDKFEKEGIFHFHTAVCDNLINTSTLFIKYLASCTFLSSCFLIFDIGHTLYRILKHYTLCKRKKTKIEKELDEMKRTLSGSKDLWYYDFGYNIAFTQIMYCIVLIFAIVAPLITIFGSLFFTIKYFIDKYNLLYVYPIEFQGQGRLQQNIVMMKYWGIFLSQVITFGLILS